MLEDTVVEELTNPQYLKTIRYISGNQLWKWIVGKKSSTGMSVIQWFAAEATIHLNKHFSPWMNTQIVCLKIQTRD